MGEGVPGLDGLSAYELARAAGFKGAVAEWLASLRGEKGDAGQDVDRQELAESVRREVQRAVDAIPRPRDGEPGLHGGLGPRGEKGEPGRDGKDASAPPAIPWLAEFQRDADGRTLEVNVTPSDTERRTWRINPIWRAGRMTAATITPV